MRFDVLETNYCREAREVALNAFGICTGLVTALDHEILCPEFIQIVLFY